MTEQTIENNFIQRNAQKIIGLFFLAKAGVYHHQIAAGYIRSAYTPNTNLDRDR